MKKIFIICLLWLLGLLGILNVTQVTAQTSKVVVLDPGHCSNDKYGEGKVPENSLNLKQVAALGDLLSSNGYTVKIYNPSGNGSCSANDYYENLQNRVDFANENKADVFISVHADNGQQDDSFNPIYSEAGPFDSESKDLGESLCSSIRNNLKISGKNISCKISESTQTGIGQSDGLEYYLLGPAGSRTAGQFGGKLTSIQREREMPGIILENYMKTNQSYTDINPFINQIAQAYCSGIAQFLDGKNCSGTVGTNTTVSSGSTSNGKSNLFCTKVGNPTEPMPAACTQGSGGGLPPGTGTPGPIGFSLSCPLGSDYSVSCGTAANPIGGRCGHGGVGYGACSAPPYATCPYSPALKASIDVVLKSGNAAGAKVYMPYVNGNESITWTKQQGPVAISGGAWGYKFIYTSVYKGKNLVLDLTHVNPSVTADVLQSGDHATSVYSGTDGPGAGHLHTALSVDGVWVEPGQDALMCAY